MRRAESKVVAVKVVVEKNSKISSCICEWQGTRHGVGLRARNDPRAAPQQQLRPSPRGGFFFKKNKKLWDCVRNDTRAAPQHQLRPTPRGDNFSLLYISISIYIYICIYVYMYIYTHLIPKP